MDNDYFQLSLSSNYHRNFRPDNINYRKNRPDELSGHVYTDKSQHCGFYTETQACVHYFRNLRTPIALIRKSECTTANIISRLPTRVIRGGGGVTTRGNTFGREFRRFGQSCRRQSYEFPTVHLRRNSYRSAQYRRSSCGTSEWIYQRALCSWRRPAWFAARARTFHCSFENFRSSVDTREACSSRAAKVFPKIRWPHVATAAGTGTYFVFGVSGPVPVRNCLTSFGSRAVFFPSDFVQ